MQTSLVVSLCLILVTPLAAHASRVGLDTEEVLGGRVIAEIDGREVAFPTLRTEVTGDLQGDIATITVRQVFANPTSTPLNARYLFPLNKDAAVHAMTMEVADEIVSARIARRSEARETFETAKTEGRSAALLEQHRPNMFTQEIANLMPGMPVTITLEYSQVVPRIDAAYELRVPLVVGPRYIPEEASPKMVGFDRRDRLDPSPQHMDDETPASDLAGTAGEWRFDAVPTYPAVAGLTIPTLVNKDRVSVNLTLHSGVPIGSVSSATHALDVAGDEKNRRISLAGGTTIDNRDFVLRYGLAGDVPQAGVLMHRDAEGGTFSILIEPPKVAREGEIAAREMVFVLDTSGSMSGVPIEASKTFMRHALSTLRPADFFRIIQFSNSANEFSAGPVPATPRNLAAGAGFINGLQAGGGTEVLSGLAAAYARPTPRNLLRIVVFLSDGYVGNEAEILRQVARNVGKGRLYAFGVGTAVNRYLIVEMARLGRGLSRIIDPTVDGQHEAIDFAGKLRTPVLTDIRIDWGDLAPTDVTPTVIPDLFEGDSIRIQGRYKGDDARSVTIRGLVNGRAVSMPLQISPGDGPSIGGAAIPLIWARSRIDDNMRELTIPPDLRQTGFTDETLEENVARLGLEYSLVTQWTSFVAVSQRIVNANPPSAQDADVPLQMVEGVTEAAYPDLENGRAQFRPSFGPTKAQAINTQVAFSGGGTPEPGQVFGLLLLALALIGAWLRLRLQARST